MVRENQVTAAAMEIELLTEVFERHRAALDMPAWTSFAPRAIPGRLAWFRGLPESKIHRMMLARIDFNARPGFHILKIAPAELAITCKFLHAVKDIAVDDISEPLVNEILDHSDDFRHCLTDTRIYIRMADIQGIHGLKVRFDVAVRDILPGHTLFIGRSDDLIIYIREVLDVMDAIAFFAK